MKYALPKMVIGYCNKVTVTLLIYMKVDQAHNFLNASCNTITILLPQSPVFSVSSNGCFCPHVEETVV